MYAALALRHRALFCNAGTLTLSVCTELFRAAHHIMFTNNISCKLEAKTTVKSMQFSTDFLLFNRKSIGIIFDFAYFII